MANLENIASGDVVDIPITTVNTQIATTEADVDAQLSLSETSQAGTQNDEQALETHEVIELQTFSERKVWIEEKIKFLEALPPIEVFAGLEDIRNFADEVIGLPSREELAQWVVEHDAIEKETEIFDTGELKKLRKLTKAATQRNLSPEDTDVIELTLTTIYALDKLLHLLRDRSENLDMMNLRLSWEEKRTASWRERRQIIEDVETFAATRGRWNPTIYDTINNNDESNGLARRGSVASQASSKSESSFNSVNTIAFSRASRYQLGEILSREAAQLSARVSSLKHGKVMLAGKILDRLIDRKTVPDELLDEQDRVEDKCITELEGIPRYTMQLVIQWRKADEIYAETLKDHTSALNLLEEIEIARIQHPTGSKSQTFAHKSDTISKRLAIRGSQNSFGNLFPRPEHFLFPNQRGFNDQLIQDLSEKVAKALTIARTTETAAKEYTQWYETINAAQMWLQRVEESIISLATSNQKLREGISGEDGDGTPPNLMLPTCLVPNSHSLYLALFPSMVQDCRHSLAKANEYLDVAPATINKLESPNVDPNFKQAVNAKAQQLTVLQLETVALLDDTSRKVARLRDSKKISANIDLRLASLKDTKVQTVETMERVRWRQQIGGDSLPLTPESPSMEIYSPIPIEEQLSEIDSKLNMDVITTLEALSATLEEPLRVYLKQKVVALQSSLKDGYQLLDLLRAIKAQSTVMASTRDDFHSLLSRIEDAKVRLAGMIDHCSKNNNTADTNVHSFDTSSLRLELLQKDARLFVEGLSTRISFVGRHPSSLQITHPLKSPPLSSQFDMSFTTATQGVPLSFDLANVDACVRSDSNSFAMRISGGLKLLEDLKAHLELTEMANSADSRLESIVSDLNTLVQELSVEMASFTTLQRRESESRNQLEGLLGRLQQMQTRHSSAKRSLSPTRRFLRQMDEKSKGLESGIRKRLYKSRVTRVDETESRLTKLGDDITSFIKEATIAAKSEQKYQDDLRAADALRIKEEEQRIASEEAERFRLQEEERRLAEEQRMLCEKLKEERIQALEQQHHAAYLADRKQHEVDAAVAETKRLAELEQEAIAARARETNQRILLEEAEKHRLERERLDALEQLRVTQAQLDQERQRFAERELATSEYARMQQYQLEELARQQATMQEQAAESSRRAEAERMAKEAAERQAKGHEEALSKQQLEMQRLMEAGVLQAELVDAEREKATRNAQQRAEELETQHIHALRLAEQHARESEIARAKAERAEEQAKHLAAQLEKERLVAEKAKTGIPLYHAKAKAKHSHERTQSLPQSIYDDSDVFGIPEKPGHRRSQPSQDITQTQSQVMLLRKRLRSICIADVLHPSKASAHLPTESEWLAMQQEFSLVVTDIEKLPTISEDSNLNIELTSLRDEVQTRARSLKDINHLVGLRGAIEACDLALSDLLEHVDSYPAAPLILSSNYAGVPSTPPEEQLSGRLAYTKGLVEDVASKLAIVPDDLRAISEYSRISQTWTELHEMANDKLSARKSRPGSVISKTSSGRESGMSVNSRPHIQSSNSRKKASYSNLSVSSIQSKGKMLAPPVPQTKSRRSVTTTQELGSRSASRVSSISSNRSVSGPMNNASLFGSTFASRQRTASLSSNTPPVPPTRTIPRKPSLTPARLRLDSQTKRGVSPAMSEHSHSSLGGPSRSTWSRAPRDSISSMLPRVVTPQKKTTVPVRKKYVANPKHKLDVAVGDVVNQLAVGINVEGITETWRDQSGKYWIGNQDPKLCFCRILRSQTVMVRVGGGWTELSRFIKDHFAESFRIAPGPMSPPRPGSQADKWISSASLLQARENFSPPPHPRTPEPMGPFLPSFSIVTPSGQSPHSLKSSSPQSNNTGSPLMPLQFMRRVEPEHPQARPSSPSKVPIRSRPSLSTTPARSSVWRP